MSNIWKMVMDWRYNPLSHIPDMNTRHMVMQVLAWMWCIIFSMWMGSVVAFGISAIAHAIFIAGIFITTTPLLTTIIILASLQAVFF